MAQMNISIPDKLKAWVESRVADGALADVVWGNHDAIDRQLANLGESRPLTEWFAAWEARPR